MYIVLGILSVLIIAAVIFIPATLTPKQKILKGGDKLHEQDFYDFDDLDEFNR